MVNDYKQMESEIALVERTRYIRHQSLNSAVVLNHSYMGTGLVRHEVLTEQATDDVYTSPKIRISEDNGRTWSQWVIDPKSYRQGEYSMELFETCRLFYPSNGKLFRIMFQRIFKGDPSIAIRSYFNKSERLFWDHAFYQLSNDEGLSWGSMNLIKYEEGDCFDESNWGRVEYLNNNIMYSGYNAVINKEDEIVYSASVSTLHTEDDINETVDGIFIFIAKWDQAVQKYEWRRIAKLSVSSRTSSRGLMEPWLAVLQDGSILLEARGSSTKLTPGRKWYSISRDGGDTWTEISDFRYSSGEQFYAPSSFAKMIRSSKNKKLYWIGNISNTLPEGNWPRRPLFIAEFDEEDIGLRKQTLTVIDDYEPQNDASDKVQFSNFSVIENRETGQLELYLTRYGEFGELLTKKYFESDVFKYVITLK